MTSKFLALFLALLSLNVMGAERDHRDPRGIGQDVWEGVSPNPSPEMDAIQSKIRANQCPWIACRSTFPPAVYECQHLLCGKTTTSKCSNMSLLRVRLFARGDVGECARLIKLLEQLEKANKRQLKRDEKDGILAERQRERERFEELEEHVHQKIDRLNSSDNKEEKST